MDRSDVKKLLNFGFNPDRTFGFVDAGFNPDIFNNNLKVLEGIGDKMLEIRDSLRDEEIRELLNRLHAKYKNRQSIDSVKLALLEAKSIGYGIDETIDTDFLVFLIQVLENPDNWTPRSLKGFLYSTLRHWYNYRAEVRETICHFILDHAQKDAKEYSSVSLFIDNDGPAKLGIFLRKNKQSWQWAPPAVLLPTTRLNYPYFSDTLINYFRQARKGEYGELWSALNLHNQMRTDKILLPLLILDAYSLDKGILDISTKRIGDPFDESQWAPLDEFNAEQRDNLKKARKVLLGWIMQEIIRIFFEVLCKDEERKSFWTRYAHHLSDFIVFGSYHSKQLALLTLPAQSVNKHFRTVDSSSNNCALAMYIGDYVIIEFTQVGALYAYKVGSNKYREAFRNIHSLSKVDDLKASGMLMLYDLDYRYFASEGKMNHQGSWRFRMETWMNRHIKSLELKA